MTEKRVYNFAAGPSMLPYEVLARAQKELTNYNGTGMSVMEMSHRSKMFQDIFNHTKDAFKDLMQVPDSHEVLFLAGGGSTQFSMVPLNLLLPSGKADYAITGNFSNIACQEASKYGQIHVSYDGKHTNYKHIPVQEELTFGKGASYFHYCDNNTIYGTEWNYVPDTHGVPLVADMSSNITSKVIDISKFGLIYAGAQKNMAPAGVTVVILQKDLVKQVMPYTPMMLEYQRHIEKDSMYNTPPCWNIYMLGLMMDWLKEQGGVSAIEQIKKEKAQILYDVLDHSHLYQAHAEVGSRSDMNVTFRTASDEMDAKFVSQAAQLDLVNLKGHRLTGGIRASIYNAMPMEGVKKLADFMEQFEKENV